MVVERRGGGGKGWGWASPLLLQLQACIGPAVDSQLLHHNNKQRPHKGRPAEQSWAGHWQAKSPPPTPAVNISTVATETELSLKASLFFSLPPFPSSSHLYLIPPSGLSLHYLCCFHPPPPPLTCFSGTNQQLSQPHSEQVHWL